MHPMDPRRGESLTPMFAAFLCWLLGLEPMTRPAITGISVTGDSVLAATTDSPFFDAHLGAVDEFERNLRVWGEACGADSDMIDGWSSACAGPGNECHLSSPGFDRHRTALDIVDPGACNPSGVALALHTACGRPSPKACRSATTRPSG